MKWFKHMTDACHDEKLAEVLDLHGAQGYGVFWLIVESVAKQMDETNKCEVKYSMKKWAAVAHVDRRSLAKYLQTFSNLALIVLQDCDNFVTIKIPKLLDLRDNHTKNLQATLPATCKQEVEVEVEVESISKEPSKKEKIDKKEKGSVFDVEARFEEVWARYPNKAGKKEALKHFRATVKDEEALERINRALDVYIQTDNVLRGYVKNGSTWFNNWEDYVDYTEPAKVRGQTAFQPSLDTGWMKGAR